MDLLLGLGCFRVYDRAEVRTVRTRQAAIVHYERVHSMKKAALSFAIAILSLSSVTAPTAYANGTGAGYYGALAYHRGRAPANAFYGYVAGQTTTFYNGYVPGYGYVALGSTITPYNGYAPYPYSRSGWWQRPVPSAPAAWW